MWLTLLLHCSIISILISPVCVHIPEWASTPSSRMELYCNLAETCVHDTIPICGKMDTDKRTFLDICDLLEYACDTNNVYTHIEDIPGCPTPKKPFTVS